MKLPIQKILFGSPGTGKSHRIEHVIIPEDLGITSRENVIKTVFHPEYTYGDFMGKLVPITRSGKVEYNYYEGHFLRALSQAYKNIYKAYDKEGNQLAEPENVALVIDEINRGNSSAIFGLKGVQEGLESRADEPCCSLTLKIIGAFMGA